MGRKIVSELFYSFSFVIFVLFVADILVADLESS